ncbi:copper chaperone [Noviherbaspirillum cavernae]|uniref:Copper chaperone n=1 Tax=Noviherbaspirillum cavernae TaxID=2320862 RepID=A0A418WXV0_9BURK|nr:cation transporter [Noviherbaspirillum cavernae]RJG04953.1 copper chaperone [Noviherbaspirillum cavernae]
MYELRVEGMSCNHCVSMVTKSVLGIDRAAKVDVDLKRGIVRVESKESMDAIKDAVSEAGYPVIAASLV